MTRPMHEPELLEVWDRGTERMAWTKVRARAIEEGDSDRQVLAEERMQKLPEPLVALTANRDLVRRLVGSRWFVVMLAREGGASWADVAAALESTEEAVIAAYTAAIETQERYVGEPLHDTARARAVLAPAGTGATL